MFPAADPLIGGSRHAGREGHASPVELHFRPLQLKAWNLSWCPRTPAIGAMRYPLPGARDRVADVCLGRNRVPGAVKIVAERSFALSRHSTQMVVFDAIFADPRQLPFGRSLNAARVAEQTVMSLKRDCRGEVLAGARTVN